MENNQGEWILGSGSLPERVRDDEETLRMLGVGGVILWGLIRGGIYYSTHDSALGWLYKGEWLTIWIFVICLIFRVGYYVLSSGGKMRGLLNPVLLSAIASACTLWFPCGIFLVMYYCTKLSCIYSRESYYLLVRKHLSGNKEEWVSG